MASFTPQEIEQFLQQFFDVVGTRQYIGARYVPIFGRKGEDTIEWDNLAPYEPLTVVMHQGVSYVSKQYVPKDVEITNTTYWAETYRFNAQVEQYRQEVLGFQSQIDQIRTDMESDYVPFPDSLVLPKYGTLGQVLTTLANGETKWEDPVVPSDEQAEEVITTWLNAHPEATTTVQDGAITLAKLAESLKQILMYRVINSGTVATIPDLNGIRTAGMYNIANYTSIQNLPDQKNGTLFVDGSTNTIQYYVSGDNIYVRSYRNSNSTWRPWYKIPSIGLDPVLYGYSTNASASVIADANSAASNSFYVIADYTNIQNLPTSTTGLLMTYGDTRNKYQIFVTTDNMYIRWYRYSNTTWYPWQPLIHKLSDCVMPSTLNVVVNKEYQIDLWNIFDEPNIENLIIDNTPKSTVVSYRENYIHLAPTNTGNTSITLAATDGLASNSKTFSMRAVSDANKPTVRAMFIGDSLTNMGYYLAELKTMMGNALTLYGTRQTTAENSENENVTVDHEGRSGWGLYDMLYRQTYKDATNAFYNPATSQFDFSYYMTQHQSFGNVTDVYIFSGPNDGNTADYITYLTTMCNSIKAYNASIRIHICMPTPPNRSGYGFGHTNNYSYKIFKTYMYNHDAEIVQAFDNTNGYFVVPTHCMLDCYYDYPKTTIQVNPRNPETIEVGNNNVHPNKYGFYRIADVIYADMIANCQ